MRVVFDINVFLGALLGPDSSWPELKPLPPASENAAIDCLSLAFDAESFQLFVSEHILSNIARVLGTEGMTDTLISRFLETILEIVDYTGGMVFEPSVRDWGVGDFEDNHLLSLLTAADADVLVTDDADLTQLNPWNGRLILRPHEFVNRMLHSRR